jgi:hypothetical protein
MKTQQPQDMALNFFPSGSSQRGLLPRLASSRLVCWSSLFFGTAINAFVSSLNLSKDSGVSRQPGGGLIFFFVTQPFFRFPRFWRGSFRPRQSLVTGSRPLADQLVVGKAFASERSRRFHKPISISSFASVESKSLFVEITKQVKRFYRNVSTFEHPFEQAPKVFDSLSMDVPLDVLFSVIDNATNVGIIKIVIARMLVGVDGRARLDVRSNAWLKDRSGSSVNNHCSRLAAVALKQAHYSNLANKAIKRKLLTLGLMKVASQSTDESFVNFDFAGQFAKRSVLHCLADSVKQKPRALLSHTERPRQFTRTDAVLRVSNQPDSGQPLIEPDRRIFHEGANLDAELLLTGFALPQAARRQVRHFAAVTDRALNAIRPAHLRKKVGAVISIRKVQDRLLQSGWETCLLLHGEETLAQNSW